MASFRSLGIATGAGLAAALLFAASTRGGALVHVAAGVAPLPIMIAALGFAQASGLVAAGVASLVVGVLLGPLSGGIFATLLAFPAWWLAYLSLLGKPAAQTSAETPAIAWYPIGRVVAWGALLVAAVFLALGAATLLHYGGYHKAIAALAREMKTALSTVEAEQPIADQAVLMIRLLPPVMAGLVFTVLAVNLWIAARVVQGSGLLSRPWPPVPENLRLPRATAVALIVAGVVSAFGGVAGAAGSIVVAPLSMAFVLQGLGTAHALTRGLAARRAILIAIYIIVVSLTPSLLALAVLGVVDCLTPLRRPRPPSPSPSNQPKRRQPWK